MKTLAQMHLDAQDSLDSIVAIESQIASLGTQNAALKAQVADLTAKLAAATVPAPVITVPDFAEDFVGITFPGGDGSYSSPNPPGTWYVQQAAAGRASIGNVSSGFTGKCAVLHTEPGDLVAVGGHRCDLGLAMPGSLPGQSWQLEQSTAAGAIEGQERWYSHSVLFVNPGFNPPKAVGAWAVYMDFHGHAAGWPQPLQLQMTTADGFGFLGGGGDGGSVRWTKAISPSPQLNVWYEFVYNIKWTSNADGFIHIWMNGKLLHKQDNQPTLWTSDSAYLKLANYHSDDGVPNTVCHRRIRIGRSAKSVALGSLEGVI